MLEEMLIGLDKKLNQVELGTIWLVTVFLKTKLTEDGKTITVVGESNKEETMVGDSKTTIVVGELKQTTITTVAGVINKAITMVVGVPITMTVGAQTTTKATKDGVIKATKDGATKETMVTDGVTKETTVMAMGMGRITGTMDGDVMKIWIEK